MIPVSPLLSLSYRSMKGTPTYLERAQLFLTSLLGNKEYFNPDAVDGWQALLRASSAEHGDPETGSVTGDYYTLESMASFFWRSAKDYSLQHTAVAVFVRKKNDCRFESQEDFPRVINTVRCYGLVQ